MTLKIKPVKLKQSIYFRVPNDIADLIGIDSHEEVVLTLEEQEERFLITYSVKKTLTPTMHEGFRETQLSDGEAKELEQVSHAQLSGISNNSPRRGDQTCGFPFRNNRENR